MAQPRMKDYLGGGWIQAANDCDECRAPQEVRVVSVEMGGEEGVIEIRVRHTLGCPSLDDDMPEKYKKAQLLSHAETAGWVWTQHKWKIADKELYLFRMVGNHTICNNCLKFIVGVPLILWGPDRKEPEWEAHFCNVCTKELKLDQLIFGGKVKS